MSFDTNTSSVEHNEKSQDSIESGLLGLEKKLSEKTGISLESIQELQKFKFEKKSNQLQEHIIDALGDLKNSVETSNISPEDKEKLGNFSTEKLQNFLEEIQYLRFSSQEKIGNLEVNIFGEKKESIASSAKQIPGISQTRFAKACNPNKPHHHIDGMIVGSYNSLYHLGKVTAKVCIDIAKLPYHIGLIARGKATTDAFNKI